MKHGVCRSWVAGLVVLAVARGAWGDSGPCHLDTLTQEDEVAFGASVAISDPWVVVGDPSDDTFCPKFVSGCGTITLFRREKLRWIRGPKLTGSHVSFNDKFGWSVDIDGDVIVVGAPHDDPSGTGIGEAYVFRFDGTSWFQQGRLIPSGSELEDRFGEAVAVSGDVIAVGAPRLDSFTGRVYIFRWNGTAWVEETAFVGPDTVAGDAFGGAVALESDLLVVGARGDDDACASEPGCESGAAYVFRFEYPNWVPQAKLTASDKAEGDLFGRSVWLAGNELAVGAPGKRDEAGTAAGAGYIFSQGSGVWQEQAKLVAWDAAPSAGFGQRVALASDVFVAGAPFAGSAYLFRAQGGAWLEVAKLVAKDSASSFGKAVALEAPYALAASGAGAHAFSVPHCIPAITEWGLVLLGLLILISGTLRLRSRMPRLGARALCVLAPNAAAQSVDLTAPHHPERLLVRFTQSVSEQVRTDIHASVGAERLREYERPAGPAT